MKRKSTSSLVRLAPESLQFLAPDYQQCSLDSARVAILPVPYERTTSYGKGTGKGPSAILRASSYLELHDEELGKTATGWVTLSPLSFGKQTEAQCMQRIRQATAEIVGMGKKVLALGGEHSVTGPLVEAHHGFANLTVLQLDAHADLRDSYEGSKLSHAAVMRRVVEKIPAVQIGIRSISSAEATALPGLPTKIFFAHQIVTDPQWMEKALACLTANVYLSVDIDVLDPSIMPSTGTPEPGGLDWYSVLRFLRLVAAKRNIVGADLVELAPIRGLRGPDFTAAKLAYKMIQMLLA